MKRKVGTLLEEDVLRRATRRAADEGRHLSDVIQDALQKYLSANLHERARRKAAFQFFCERPIELAPAGFVPLRSLGLVPSRC